MYAECEVSICLIVERYYNIPQMIYSPGTYHTHRHTLKATMFNQKNADMKAKYNINPKMQTYGLDNNEKSEGHEFWRATREQHENLSE